MAFSRDALLKKKYLKKKRRELTSLYSKQGRENRFIQFYLKLADIPIWEQRNLAFFLANKERLGSLHSKYFVDSF